jgi:molecular chaperone DnaK (HSP70)
MILILLISIVPIFCNVLPVLIVDLGAESLKLALLVHSTRQFFDVVLNEQGARRIDSTIAFRNHQRLFGSAAKSASLRTRLMTYASPLVTLLRANINSTIDPQDILDNDNSGVLRLRTEIDPPTFVAAETLLAMQLQYCADVASKHGSVLVRHVLYIVPADVNDEQRLALQDVASIAGLNPLGFIASTQAASLAFALDHGLTLDDYETRTVAVVDIGASQASISVARVGKQSLKVLSTVADRSVSGRAFDQQLAAIVSRKAGGARITPALLDSAARAKRVLSVNRDATVKVDDANIVTVTRDEFDAESSALLAAIGALAARALAEAGIGAADVQLVEIVGGGTRVPSVQNALRQALGRECSHHINSDEGGLFGGAYFAAHLAPYTVSVVSALVESVGIAAVRDAPPRLSAEELDAGRATLEAWRARDALEQSTVNAKNELESYIFATKELLSEAVDLRLYVEQSAVDKLLAFCESQMAWLDGEGSNAVEVGRADFESRLAQVRAERRAAIGAFEAAVARDAALERLEVALQAVPRGANVTSAVTGRKTLIEQRAAVRKMRSLLEAGSPIGTAEVSAELLSAEQIDKRTSTLQSDVEKWHEKLRAAEAKRKAKEAADAARSWLDDIGNWVRKVTRRVSRYIGWTELSGIVILIGLAGPVAWNRFDAWRQRRRQLRGFRHAAGGYRLDGRKFD